MKKVLIVAAVFGVGLIGVVAALFFSINPLIEKGVNTYGPSLTGTAVTLQQADVSFFSGEGALKGLVVGNPAGYKGPYALKIGTIKVSLDPRSLSDRTIVIKKLEIIAPDVLYERHKGVDNFNAILNHIQKTLPAGGSKPDTGAQAAKSAEPATQLVIDDLIIRDIKAAMYVPGLGTPVNMKVADIRLRDVGRGGQSVASVAETVFRSLGLNIGKAATSTSLREAGKSLKNSVEGLGNSLKGLFGK